MKKKLLLVGAIAGLAAFVIKTKARQDGDWHGLTEQEARDRVTARIPSRLPADKRDLLADKIVGKMRDRGVLAEDVDAVDLSDSGSSSNGGPDTDVGETTDLTAEESATPTA